MLLRGSHIAINNITLHEHRGRMCVCARKLCGAENLFVRVI